MICVEDIGSLLPSNRTGKIVGIASFKGEYVIVACEHGLYRIWDDGLQLKASISPESDRQHLSAGGSRD